MKKRFLAALLALAMVVALLPATAKAAASEVWIGSTDVSGYSTPQSLYDGTVQYSGGVLTLNGVTVTDTDINEHSAAIFANGDLIIELIDTNNVTGPGLTFSYGVCISGNLTVRGAGTLNATGASMNSNFSYGVFAYSITVLSGTLKATGGSSSSISYGVYAMPNPDGIIVSGGTLEATGGSGTSDNSYGMQAQNIILTGGTTTATGNTRAVSWQPVFHDATQTNGNWYMWKESAADADRISSKGNQFSNTLTKYLKVTPARYATVSDVTVSGTTGTAITGKDVTLTLTGETFKSRLAANADVSSWFTNLPKNLSAKIKTEVTAGSASATVTISGTPTEASTAAMAITIPATALTNGEAITAVTNANAKYNIVAPTPLTITTEPQDTTVTEGSISGALTVGATGTGTLTYQWSMCDDTSKANASAIDSATTASFNLPTGLSADTYYYFCSVKLNNGQPVDSRVATVTVNPALPISITPDTAFPAGMSGGDRTVVVGHGTGLAAGNIGTLSADGNPLTLGTDYTKADSASVDITLKESWLNSLPAGTHRLNIPVTSGVFAGQTPYINIVVTGTGGAGSDADVPKTGDGSMPLLWAGLVLLAGAGLFVLGKRRRT